MRLFFIVDNNAPHASGGGYYAIFKFAEFLARRGNKVFIYAVNDLGWVENNENLQVYYRPSISRDNRFLRKLDKLLEIVCDRLLLPRLAKEFDPGWILGVLKESAIKAVGLGGYCQRPVANFIYECPSWLREIYGEEVYQSSNNDFTRKLWSQTKDAYLASDILFPNSTLSQQYNQEWLNSTVAAPIYPGVDETQMPFNGPLEPVNGRAVLFVGRLAPEKNIHHLIKAWRQLPKDVVLHIAGSGPLLGELQQLSADLPNVIFHGYVSDNRLWALFRSAKMLVCPTQFEGFGMPPMQALYFQKPCLVSDLPIFRSIYGDHIDYFPIGDVEALAEGVLRILENQDYAQAQGKRGRNFVLDNFTWQVAAETIEQQLQAASDKSLAGTAI
jgi:glycosyltransferase involved in cell wall biosynthesis